MYFVFATKGRSGAFGAPIKPIIFIVGSIVNHDPCAFKRFAGCRPERLFDAGGGHPESVAIGPMELALS